MRLANYLLLLLPAVLFCASCTTGDKTHRIVVSIPDQKMVVYDRDQELARYDVSTSKFGLGNRPGSRATPLGRFEVARKIGDGAPLGMKFKDRRPTGEIVQADAPGRDPIVTRILWLKGLDAENRNSYDRTIYIHGTAEERKIGSPASFGCVRMRSRDVLRLFDTVGVGARVSITTATLPPTQGSAAESPAPSGPSGG